MRKKKNKKGMGWFVKYNAGNVDINNDFFNNTVAPNGGPSLNPTGPMGEAMENRFEFIEIVPGRYGNDEHERHVFSSEEEMFEYIDDMNLTDADIVGGIPKRSSDTFSKHDKFCPYCGERMLKDENHLFFCPECKYEEEDKYEGLLPSNTAMQFMNMNKMLSEDLDESFYVKIIDKLALQLGENGHAEVAINLAQALGKDRFKEVVKDICDTYQLDCPINDDFDLREDYNLSFEKEENQISVKDNDYSKLDGFINYSFGEHINGGIKADFTCDVKEVDVKFGKEGGDVVPYWGSSVTTPEYDVVDDVDASDAIDVSFTYYLYTDRGNDSVKVDKEKFIQSLAITEEELSKMEDRLAKDVVEYVEDYLIDSPELFEENLNEGIISGNNLFDVFVTVDEPGDYVSTYSFYVEAKDKKEAVERTKSFIKDKLSNLLAYHLKIEVMDISPTETQINFMKNRGRYVYANGNKEEPVKEGIISGNDKKLSYDDLTNLERDLYEYLRKEWDLYPSDGTFNNARDNFSDLELTLYVDGDWKHDHLATQEAVKEFCDKANLAIINHEEVEIGESDSDSYEAKHTWKLAFDEDDKRVKNKIDSFKKMFS